MFLLIVLIVVKCMGIVGLGNIGWVIVMCCVVLGYQIGYFGCSWKLVDYVFFDDLVVMVVWVDILIVVIFGGLEIEGLVFVVVIDVLGFKGMLVSVVCGFVIDEVVLIVVLWDGWLGLVGLDVYLNELNFDLVLICLLNVVFYLYYVSGIEEICDCMV